MSLCVHLIILILLSGLQVMPYLARRAVENKAVLGNGAAALERKQAWAAMRKRFLG